MAFIEHVFLETTNKCCANCLTCLNRTMKRERGVMNLDLFKKLVDDVVDGRKTNVLHLYGAGEPYLTPSYMEYCNYAIEKCNQVGIETEIITNGMLITDIPDGLTRFIISFNAGKKETYEKITGLDFDRTLNNIYRLANEGQFEKVKGTVEVHMLVFKDNEEEIEEFKNLFIDLKKYGVILRLGYKYDNQLGLIEDKTLDKYKTTERLPCHYVKNVLNICWDGKVVSCPHDFDGVNIYGDANMQSIDELIRSNVRMNMLKDHLKGIFTGLCENCNYNVSFDGKYEFI